MSISAENVRWTPLILQTLKPNGSQYLYINLFLEVIQYAVCKHIFLYIFIDYNTTLSLFHWLWNCEQQQDKLVKKEIERDLKSLYTNAVKCKEKKWIVL